MINKTIVICSIAATASMAHSAPIAPTVEEMRTIYMEKYEKSIREVFSTIAYPKLIGSGKSVEFAQRYIEYVVGEMKKCHTELLNMQPFMLTMELFERVSKGEAIQVATSQAMFKFLEANKTTLKEPERALELIEPSAKRFKECGKSSLREPNEFK